MTELTEIWENVPELKQYFATRQSFCAWMGRHYLLENPTIEEILKKAKKRLLTCNERIKFKKRHILMRG